MSKITIIKGIILFSLFHLGLLTACSSECIRVRVNKNERVWINNLNKGDTIRFQSTTMDNFREFVLIEHVDTVSPCNRFELGEYHYDLLMRKYYENGEKKKVAPIQIDLYKDMDNRESDLSNKYIKVFELRESIYDTLNIPKKEIQLGNGFKYSTFFFESKSLQNEPKSFCWSLEQGLLRFTKQSGEVFTRVL